MAPIEKKRARKVEIAKSRKCQKLSRLGRGPEGERISKAVSLDTLPWQEVAFPESGYEDAEGFFGLEEISDVDVVRDSKLGKVEYKISSKKPEAIKQGESKSILKSKGQQTTRPSQTVDRNEEEWEASTEDVRKELQATTIINETAATRAASRKTEAKARKRRKKESKESAKTKATRQVSSNAFEALSKADEDDNDGLEEGDVSAWDSVDLSGATLASLARLNYCTPTAIQKAAIPDIQIGHDVIGKAPTGSGKTLAFGIPIYERFLIASHTKSLISNTTTEPRKHSPTALILSPTRELAHQLSAHLIDLCSHPTSPNPSIATVTGGLSVHKQQRLLANADIIVGTPGRLWEVINGSPDLSKSLKKIDFLVVDEADRLLSEGHFKEVEEILRVLDLEEDTAGEGPGSANTTSSGDRHRQTLVFSATFQKDLQQKLAGKSQFSGGDLMGKKESMEYLLKKLNFKEEKPKFIDVNPITQMASGLKEGIVECAGTEKDLYLYTLLLHHSNIRTLILTNSINSVRRLTPFLQNLNLPAHALHSQMPQKARLRSIERFSSLSSQHSILIATDVAARGLDILSVELVVHYHLPRAADMYVHRSGRTARAEKSGTSILLCAPEEVQGVRRLVAKVHARNAIASSSNSESKKFYMHTIELDTRVLSRLKQRAMLSKKISDASLAKEKKGHEDNWLKAAAEELGVEYDSEEFAAGEGSKKGRGQGRKRKEAEARALTKAEIGSLRAELREELEKRVNVGVSERYLTAGGVDIDELLRGERVDFLGRVDGRMDDT
ncbi:hypothetical protein N7G274_002495 [Stereocaulon virgatum]|uniref:RNA helicase n=1 Tax=Stereocaulon virgatum TaxID=373712 RepID=A0ABR4AIP3_9LECA